MVTKGKWDKEGNRITVSGSGVIAICPSPTTSDGVMEFIANTNLVVSCVNACKSVNQDNPQAVAESIEDVFKVLKEVRDSAVLEKKETGFYILRLQYSSWQDVCNVLAKADRR